MLREEPPPAATGWRRTPEVCPAIVAQGLGATIMNWNALRACDLECGSRAAMWFLKEVILEVEATVAGQKVQRPGACP